MQNLLIILTLLGWSVTAVAQDPTVGLLHYDAAAQPGYTLWTSGFTSHLIDNCGRKIHRWDHDTYPGRDVYLQENGDILRAIRMQSELCSGCSQGGGIQRVTPDGTITWFGDFTSPTYHAHHDHEPLPNGNILVLMWELVTEDEALALGRNPELMPTVGELYTEMIWEIQPVGADTFEVVWEWHIKDHLVQNFDAGLEGFGDPAVELGKLDINVGPTSADWLHANSIDYHPERDEITLSLRYISEVIIIDHALTSEEAAGPAGDFLWRWGNPTNYGTEAPALLDEQHDARFIRDGFPGEGHLTIFDNNLNGTTSVVREVAPTLDASGNYVLGAPEAEQEVWNWTNPDMLSLFISGAQRQPNGNTLVCEGDDGTFWEINPAGELVWKYRHPVYDDGTYAEQGTEIPNGGAGSASAFRCQRILPDHPGLAFLDLTPGEPLEINPDPIPPLCIEIVDNVPEYGAWGFPFPNPVAPGRQLSVPGVVQNWRWLTVDGRVIETGSHSLLTAPQQPGMWILEVDDFDQIRRYRIWVE